MKYIFKLSIILGLLSALIHADTFNIHHKDDWLKLLENKEYEVLEKRLSSLYSVVQKDITKEPDMLYAFQTFNNSAKEIEQGIQEWRKMKPHSLFAVTAWGMYNIRLAWISRGNRSIGKTSSKQISKMNAYIREAKDSLEMVVKKDPKLTVAIQMLLQVYLVKGSDKERSSIFNASLKENPYSSIVREIYAKSLTPKWGGSWKELRLFLDETKALSSNNSALSILDNYDTYVRSDMLRLTKDFDKALYLSYLNQLLSQSPNNSRYYTLKGDYYFYYANNNEKAIKNYEKRLQMYPGDAHVLNNLGIIYMTLKDNDKALVYFDKSLKYDGLYSMPLRAKGKILYLKNKMNLALQAFQDSLVYASENSMAFTYMGYIYFNKKNYTLAVQNLEHSNTIEPLTEDDWYIITASQWHERDCKFVKSASIFEEKCKISDTPCNAQKLEWAKKSAKFAKDRGICK
jgi:tetratricopeptide (TPR) repeat protein